MGQISPIAAYQAVPRPDEAGIVPDEIGFCAWIAQAEPGQTLIYHRGFLAVDANATVSRLSAVRLQALQQLANAAWRAAEQNLIHLIQKRLGPDEFAYIAIARPKSSQAAAPLSMRLLEDVA